MYRLFSVILVLGVGGWMAYGFVYDTVDFGFFNSLTAILAIVAIFAFPLLAKYLPLNKKSRPDRSTTNELGSGDLASTTDIRRWLKKNDELDTVLPVEGLKGSNGIALKSGELIIPGDERNRHILVIAKTGSGKTTKAILPVLYHDCLSKQRSTIVLDSKPEMWQKLAAMTSKYNPEKHIMLFNPLDKARSLSWNILSKVEDDTDAKLIANTIVMATDNPNARADSPFFRNNALQLLNSIMIGLLHDPNEKISMPRIHEIIHSGMETICEWLEAHPHAIRNTKAFVDLARSGSQNADTILSELSMRLAAWDLNAIRATTFEDELDIAQLIERPTLFIIELRESELEMLRPMANVIVIEALRFLTKRAEQFPGGRLPRPVGLVIDEFASALGRLPDIHVKLNTLRSRNVSIVAAIQSIAQIKANYDKDADSVLAGFSTKILMPALDFQDSEWASKETGTMTVRFNVASKGKNRRLIDHFAYQNRNTQEQVQQRAVLTPDEIGRPIDNACTFFMPNTPVFQGHMVPYYKIPEMNKRLSMTPSAEEELKLREAPLEFTEELPLAAGVMDEQAKQELLQSLEETKVKIEWEYTQPAAKEWWDAFEKANADNLSMVLGLAEEIAKRKSSINDFYRAFVKSNADNIPDVLNHLDYQALARAKGQLNWQNTAGAAREWWEAFEAANQANMITVLNLCDELTKRNATIEEFFTAYVYSDTDCVEEVLLHLDVMRDEAAALRRRETKQRNEASGTSSAPRSIDALLEKAAQPTEIPVQAAPVQAAPVQTEIPAVTPQAAEQPVTRGATVEKHEIQPEQKDVSPERLSDLIVKEKTKRVWSHGHAAEADPVIKAEEEIEDSELLQQQGEAEVLQSGPTNGGPSEEQPAERTPEEEEQLLAVHFRAGKHAAKKLHLASYFEMGENFLKDGKVKDFTSLLNLAREDRLVTEEDMQELFQLGAQYGVTDLS